MSVKAMIVSTGIGQCALTGKEGSDGLTIAFENEQPCFVSWKAFRQLVSFRTAQGQPKPAAATVPVGNGAPALVK